jgi:hypothetical protein
LNHLLDDASALAAPLTTNARHIAASLLPLAAGYCGFAHIMIT